LALQSSKNRLKRISSPAVFVSPKNPAAMFHSRLRNIFFLLAAFILYIILAIGCASTKVKEVRQLHRSEKYEQVIEADANCDDPGKDCLRIKLMRADSYLKTGKPGEALQEVELALQLIDSHTGSEDRLKAYLLQGMILMENIRQNQNQVETRELLFSLKESLDKSLETVEKISGGKTKKIYMQRIQTLSIQYLLQKMQYADEDQLKFLYQKVLKKAGELEELMPDKGFQEYYSIAAKFDFILPEAKKWILTGHGNREELLVVLRDLYQQGVSLRNEPIYSLGYADEIDNLLNQIDRFMRRFVL
jgi:hypothetical protein